MSDFRLGDIVETIKGAKFWGEIIAIDNDGNSPGCTVLAVDPGFAGTKHVYPLKQLAHRAPSPSPAPGVVEELLSDLATRPIIDGINYRALIRDFQERALRALSQPAKGELPDRDTSKPAEQQGLFRKFEVRRTDGSDQPGGKHHGCRYFVIDIDHDQYATDALTAYADACARTHPELARDLREKWGAASPANPAQGVREALSDCLDMLARFTHSTSNDLNHVEARAVYRAGRAALAAIGAAPKPPGWPDPLESPQAEAIRNGKLDDTEIRNLFDCMERELRLHRERAANPAQGLTDAMVDEDAPDVDDLLAKIARLETVIAGLNKQLNERFDAPAVRDGISAHNADFPAWVLEHADSPTNAPRYWAAGQIDPLRSSAWTENHMAAIRFAREEDAAAVRYRLMKKAGVDVRVCEHIWSAAIGAGGQAVADEELHRYIAKCNELAANGEYAWWSRLAEILSALASNKPAGDGYVLVPKEPTEEMIDAGDRVMYGRYGCSFEVAPIYEAMLAASGESIR